MLPGLSYAEKNLSKSVRQCTASQNEVGVFSMRDDFTRYLDQHFYRHLRINVELSENPSNG